MTKIIHGLLMCLAFFAASPSHAQEYPNKVITIVVPYAAGGPTDTVARLIAVPMTKTLKSADDHRKCPWRRRHHRRQSGGQGGARWLHAIDSPYRPLHRSSALSKLPYDAINDFEPIGLINEVPMTMVAKKDFPAKDLKELIAYVKANKEKINLANAGLGAASHLCGMLFMSAIQTELTTVPYNGTAPAMNDLLGGQVDIHVRPNHQHDQPNQS